MNSPQRWRMLLADANIARTTYPASTGGPTQMQNPPSTTLLRQAGAMGDGIIGRLAEARAGAHCKHFPAP